MSEYIWMNNELPIYPTTKRKKKKREEILRDRIIWSPFVLYNLDWIGPWQNATSKC